MGQNNYSKQLKLYTGELSVETQRSIQDIKALLNKRKLDILEWDKDSIAISVVLNIQLPPRGNYQNIDIREKEPVLIVFNNSLMAVLTFANSSSPEKVIGFENV